MFLNISGEPIPAAIIPALKMIPVRPMATKAVAKNQGAGSKLDFHRGAILPDRRLCVAARFQAADGPEECRRGDNGWRHRNGEPLDDFRCSWRPACVLSCAGEKVHGLSFDCEMVRFHNRNLHA